MGGVSVAVLVIAVVIAAAAGFGGCYLWRRSREIRLAAAQAEALSAKADEVARAKHEFEEELAAKEAAIAEGAAALAASEARAAELEDRVAALERDLEQAQVTFALDRYSDFQLLGMCDVFDAEETEGALRRPYGDPAMEQLMNLGIVDFEMPHDGGRDKTPLWTLKPAWRAAVKACRPQMDARTEELRARRDAKQAL